MLQACQAVVLVGTPVWKSYHQTQNGFLRTRVDLGSLGYGLLGGRVPRRADHRLTRRYLPPDAHGGTKQENDGQEG